MSVPLDSISHLILMEEELTGKIDTHTAEREEIRAIIRSQLEPGEVGSIGGKPLYRRYVRVSKILDSKRLKLVDPDVWYAYARDSVSDRLERVREES